MKSKFYAANDGKALCQVITELGKDNISISVADNKLNWNTIKLNEEQSKGFKKFMRDNDT